MAMAIAIFFVLPWLDRSPVKSWRYKGWMTHVALYTFAFTFLFLGYLGAKPANIEILGVDGTTWARIFTAVYFAFFIGMPFYSKYDKTYPVPERLTY